MFINLISLPQNIHPFKYSTTPFQPIISQYLLYHSTHLLHLILILKTLLSTDPYSPSAYTAPLIGVGRYLINLYLDNLVFNLLLFVII